MSNFQPGQRVHYKPSFGEPENGIVKLVHPHNPRTVFVVYKCGGNWDSYQNYTAASTNVADLRDGWVLPNIKPLPPVMSAEELTEKLS
jgi:hypothetical protein